MNSTRMFVYMDNGTLAERVVISNGVIDVMNHYEGMQHVF